MQSYKARWTCTVFSVPGTEAATAAANEAAELINVGDPSAMQISVLDPSILIVYTFNMEPEKEARISTEINVSEEAFDARYDTSTFDMDAHVVVWGCQVRANSPEQAAGHAWVKLQNDAWNRGFYFDVWTYGHTNPVGVYLLTAQQIASQQERKARE